jgi:NAD(P)-dependent dehydrogenase (short-subunit alcohol dehydrogenase family)
MAEMLTNKKSRTIDVVTGASQGLGREVALQFARLGHTVVMVARKTPRLDEAVRYVTSACPQAAVVAIPADLSLMADVRHLAEEIADRFDKVNVLIHCAAVILQQREVTNEGFEATFATNAMAPFLLSCLLYDQLLAGAPARVIFFYGGGRSSFDLANLMSELDYNGWIAYNQTKNADVMITLELSDRWDGIGIDVNCVFPGLVETAIMQGVPMYMRIILGLMRPVIRTPSQGAAVAVWAGTAPELVNVSGKLFGSFVGNPRHEIRQPLITRDPERRRELIRLLSNWTGLDREGHDFLTLRRA